MIKTLYDFKFSVKVLTTRYSRNVILDIIRQMFLCLYFVGVIYFHCGTKNPKIIVDGYDFYLEKRKETKTYWFCSSNSSMRCRVRVTTSGSMVQVAGKHNHPPKTTKLTNLRSKSVTILRHF